MLKNEAAEGEYAPGRRGLARMYPFCGFRCEWNISALSGCFVEQLSFDRDRNLVAHHETTAFNQRVPNQAKIFPVDFRRCRDASPHIAPWILDGGRRRLHVE